MTKLRPFLIIGILLGLSGCDNVTWGGVEVHLETSEDRLEAMGLLEPTADDSTAVAETAAVDLGPLVLVGRPSGSGVELDLVGQLRGGAVYPVEAEPDVLAAVAERLAAGREFSLYSEGTAVGSFVVTGSGASTAYCGTRPSITGDANLIAGAEGAQQFIAIEGDGPAGSFTTFTAPAHNYDQRVGSLAMIRDLLPVLGAPWPPSTLEIRRDVQVFRGDAGRELVAATFVYQDELSVGSAPSNAYSVFLMGDDDGSGYRPFFVSYRSIADDGKASPRFFDHLDFDGDGTSEIVLEVFGESGAWVSVLDVGADGWQETYTDACGTALGPNDRP